MVISCNFSNVSYAAGDLGEGYNIANIDAQYTTANGENISSHSEGGVTILLFARTNGRCSNSVTAIHSLCHSAWIQREGVRVLIIDIDREPVETVKAMQTQSGESPAIFCYDETSAALNRMWDYVDLTSVYIGPLPVLVIIDKNNKVQ